MAEKGLDILVSVKIGEVYTVVGGQKGATLNRSSETIDVTNKVSGGWKENISGFKEWSIDCDGLVIIDDAGFDALETAFMAGLPVELKFAKGTTLTYEGEALITDFPIEAPYDDATTYSVSFTGNGALV